MTMTKIPKRKQIRLKHYDYSLPGWYYITICTQNRECLFGDIVDDKMVLNNVGTIAKNEWLKTSKLRKNVRLDVYRIMPNHLHGIVVITNKIPHRRGLLYKPESTGVCNTQSTGVCNTQSTGVCNTPLPPRGPSNDLGAIIRGFKSTTTKQIRQITNNSKIKIWQRNFYEHIIRTENDLNKIRKYIESNPKMWGRDRNNPNPRKSVQNQRKSISNQRKSISNPCESCL